MLTRTPGLSFNPTRWSQDTASHLQVRLSSWGEEGEVEELVIPQREAADGSTTATQEGFVPACASVSSLVLPFHSRERTRRARPRSRMRWPSHHHMQHGPLLRS